MATPILCKGCGQKHDPLLRCPSTMSEAQAEAAGKAIAKQVKKTGVRIALKPTLMHTTPAAEKMAAAHGMTVAELRAKLAEFEAKAERRRVQIRAAVKKHRQKGKS